MNDDGDIGRLQRRLAAIPKQVKEAVRPAMEKSAAEIVALARSLCPVDDGKLRASIGWTWGAAPSGSMKLAAETSGELTITVYAGNDEAFYARWVEFGTQAGSRGDRVADARRGGGNYTRKVYRDHPGTAAQPFFYPAFRLSKKRVAARTKRAIGKAVKENWGKS